jgi:hypothetical protein
MLYTFLSTYIAPAVLTALASALGLVLLDFVMGVLVALKTHTFQFSKLPQFMESSLIPYVGGLLILALFSTYPQIETTFYAITAAIGVKFIADISSKIAQLFGGLNIQIQSPISVKKSEPVIQSDSQPVSPSTDVSTNTPAADKTVPAENNTPEPGNTTPAQ